MIIKVGKFIFPVDFVVIDIEEDKQVPLLLRRPFLTTRAALIDVKKGELNLNKSLKQSEFDNTDFKIVETKVPISSKLINDCKNQSSMNENEINFQYLEYPDVEFLNSNFELKETVLSIDESSAEKYNSYEEKASEVNTSLEGLILKEFPKHLKYAFLKAEKSKPVIISVDLTEHKEKKLREILKKYKGTIAWSIEDL